MLHTESIHQKNRKKNKIEQFFSSLLLGELIQQQQESGDTTFGTFTIQHLENSVNFDWV